MKETENGIMKITIDSVRVLRTRPSTSALDKYAYGKATVEGQEGRVNFMIPSPLHARLAELIVEGATIEVEGTFEGPMLRIRDAKTAD